MTYLGLKFYWGVIVRIRSTGVNGLFKVAVRCILQAAL